ncbi:unnamed protein product [Hydatigera taeniaeformis]|uniref:CCDC34 domain-containing protein n=1 Tax=Hydatigena taeniaeformis TaxID=6205 RepID=A0A0R3WHV1_HYDTA|nr:unnamed protein product [Hydatigera taeniaeformis]
MVLLLGPSCSGGQEDIIALKEGRASSKVDVLTRSPRLLTVGATRGNRRAVGLAPQSAYHLRSIPRPLRPSAPPLSAPSMTADGGSQEADEPDMRNERKTRVQSSLELRDLAFQLWCAKRGKQYLEERRSEQLRRKREEEGTRKQKMEKAKENEKIFAMWLAKKRAQEMDQKKKRLKEEEEKQKEEESKNQQKIEAAKAYKAWKNQKSKQGERRRSAIEVTREITVEEMKMKFDKALAAHLAFEQCSYCQQPPLAPKQTLLREHLSDFNDS